MTRTKSNNYNSQIRMIGNYAISELSSYKDFYIKTNIIKGPKE